MNKAHFEKAVAFGQQLIKTGDLDPVYIAVHKTDMKPAELARWLLAYSCLYHLAASVYLAQFKDSEFWDMLEVAAINKGLTWPRGSERRHWRGHSSIECVAWLRKTFKRPKDAVASWKASTCFEVLENVKKFPYYGPWIAFKVADLLERVAGCPVDFSQFELGVYSEPRKGAALLLTGDAETTITDSDLRLVVSALQKQLGRLKAPPTNDRCIGVQEIETVLCKYKSHVGGHYPSGKDTLEVAHGLQDDRFQCAAVKRMLAVITPMTKQWSVK